MLEAELENALRASVLAAYAQGYDLIAEASREEGWNIDLAEVSRIWQGGCIIRAKVLAFLRKAFLDVGTDGKTPHLFEIPEVRNVLVSASPDWRKIVGGATENGIPVPTISAGLSYFDSLANDSLPANFLQGLRDHFGAHTYERNDRTGTFHSHWGA
ncbi:MAG: 6-phosphogluconate dehydrogenase [Patescibacteria group bacterium]|nr:6-phosphogluconate dehydrogenase [Patescibacteria group bacterium]